MVWRQASRSGDGPAPALAGSLLELLVGLDLALVLLHLAVAAPLLLRGAGAAAVAAALGTADDSLLGMMAPGQYAAAAFLLAARARRGGPAALWRAVAAAGLLTGGDLLSLPARFGGDVAAGLGLDAGHGLAPPQLGKLVVGGALAALMVVLAGPPARSAEPETRAVGRALLLATLALVVVNLLLDLPEAWIGTGLTGSLLLDPAEELAEALTATFTLTAIVRLCAPGRQGASRDGTFELAAPR